MVQMNHNKKNYVKKKKKKKKTYKRGRQITKKEPYAFIMP